VDSSAQLIQRLNRIFGDGVERQVAEAIFEFLVEFPGTTHITISLVRRLTNVNTRVQDAAILRTLQYLAGGSINVLNSQFELMEGDMPPIVLTDDEVGQVLSLGMNPITGQVDPEIKSKVAIFFTPTAEMLSQLAAESGSPKREL
jgi:hypothetical protein